MTGVLFDSGLQASRAVPIYEGYVLPHAALSLDLGGDGLTEHLVAMLKKRCFDHTTSAGKEMVEGFKKTQCYVALDFDAELQSIGEGCMVDTTEIGANGESCAVLGSERIRCPKALFQPCLLSSEADGVHTIIASSIRRCDAEVHNAMYGNIVLADGSTLFPGFKDRLEVELRKWAPECAHVGVVASPERKYMAWIGGSILSCSPTFRSYWFTKDRYNDVMV